jgi:hypothetical protein
MMVDLDISTKMGLQKNFFLISLFLVQTKEFWKVNLLSTYHVEKLTYFLVFKKYFLKKKKNTYVCVKLVANIFSISL